MGNRFLDNGETTYTVRLTGLADHTMVRVNWDADFARTTASWGQGQVRISMSGGSSPQTQDLFFYGDWYNADVVGESQNKGRWFKSSGPTLDLTFSIEDITGESYRDRFEIYLYGIQIYTPSISLGGGGTVTEGGNTPMTFGVSRDLPTGYAGTSSGDEAIPDTSVSLLTGGTANTDDYTGLLPSSATLTSDNSNLETFSVYPKDDLETEGPETLSLTAQASSEYEVASPTASGVIADAVYSISAPTSATVSANQSKDVVASVLKNGNLATDKQINVVSASPIALTVSKTQSPNGTWSITLHNEGNNTSTSTVAVTISLVDNPDIKTIIQVTVGGAN